jgi:thermitase
MKSAFALILAASWLTAAPVPPPKGLEVRIDGDRITLRANDTPLKDILAEFVHAGIVVKVDPDIDSRVSGSVKKMDISQALDELLVPYGYALIWDVVPGPLGDIERLEEIQVFRRDGPRRVEAFMPETNFRVVQGPSGGPEFVADEILLAVKPGTNIEQFKLLIAQIGGTVIGSAPELGIYRIRLPPNSNVLAIVDMLKNNLIISRVEPNYAYKMPAQNPADAATADSTSASASNAKKGVPPVAVLDSGIQSLSSLDGLIKSAYDAVQPDRRVDDRAGHGTQMALIASGAIPPSGTSGSESGVPIVAIRAFDDNGYTTSFTMMRAIEYATDQGAKVMNISWGSDTPSTFLESSMKYAQSKGLVVVASAGNVPSGKPVYPASYPGVISVSALNADGSAWDKSNYGSTVTLAAPGTANLPVGHEGPPGGYAGTSIASAYVARNAALYLEKNPNASPAQVKQALINASSPPPSGAVKYGSGSLDDDAVSRLLQ